MRHPLAGPLLVIVCVTSAAAQTPAPSDTLTAGTPEFEEIRIAVDSQLRVRVTTQWGRVQLFGPRLTGQGMGFATARFEKRPPRGMRGFRRPLPLSEISQIDVRVGNMRAGALIGAGAGLLLTTGAYALCDEDCESGTGSQIAIYAAVTTVTTLVGAAIGRDGWGWRPIYSSDRDRTAELSLGVDGIRLTLRLPSPETAGYTAPSR